MIFFFFENTKYFNTYTHGEMRDCLKETNSGVYLKLHNS